MSLQNIKSIHTLHNDHASGSKYQSLQQIENISFFGFSFLTTRQKRQACPIRQACKIKCFFLIKYTFVENFFDFLHFFLATAFKKNQKSSTNQLIINKIQ